MHLMFRNQAFYNIHENTVSFFRGLSSTQSAYFNTEKINSFKRLFKKELEVLGMSLP